MAVEPRFDDAIHALTRLRLCSAVRPVSSVEFGVLREILGVSDANLSKTVRSLADLGYVTTVKEPSRDRQDTRRITYVSLTQLGRARFDAHIAALRLLGH